MATTGYDYETLGVLHPFVIQSILGGELNLLPSPEKVGMWLTWGFNPYDAGNEYSDVSEIPIEGAVMRVPMYHVNLATTDTTHDFAQYVKASTKTVYDQMRSMINNLGIDTAMDESFTQKIVQIGVQLNNITRVAAVYNQMPIVQEGKLAPVAVRFGKRYHVREIHEEPVTVEQEGHTHYDVIDLSTFAVESTWDTEDAAKAHAETINADNDEDWIYTQVQEIAVTDERLTTSVQSTVTDKLIAMGKGWGDEITTSDIDVALP